MVIVGAAILFHIRFRAEEKTRHRNKYAREPKGLNLFVRETHNRLTSIQPLNATNQKYD